MTGHAAVVTVCIFSDLSIVQINLNILSIKFFFFVSIDTNFAWRNECNRCKEPKSGGGGGGGAGGGGGMGGGNGGFRQSSGPPRGGNSSGFQRRDGPMRGNDRGNDRNRPY